MFKKIFIGLIFIVFISCFSFFKHYFSIFYFQNDANKLSINIESKNTGDINICFDKNCDLMQYQNGTYFYKLNQQNPLFYNSSTKHIEIITEKENTKNDFNTITIFYNLNDIFYASKNDIELIKSKEINFEGKKKFSQEILFNQANSKTFIQKSAVYFEGIFYNWYFYLISYILIILYLIKYQERFDFKIKFNICAILVLALFLRLSHIDYIPLWNDELYTFCFISNLGSGLNLEKTFIDPGNPPLFFILSNIWFIFFNKTIASIRLLPCIIGILQIYSIYFVAKKIFNKKTALCASFLCAINIILILESNEIRSYILSMVLILWGLYWFYKLKTNFSNRSLIIFSIITILLINTHYYCIFFVLANFILGLVLFKNNRLKFLIANLICALTFLPYLFKTVLNYSLNKGFNNWIEKPSIEMLNNHIVFYFGNIYWLILIVIFSIFIFKKLEKKEREIFLYTIFTISFVFILALLISIFIKPCLFERYFIIFIPFLILNTALFLNIDYKTKFSPIIACSIFLFSINMPKYENFNLFSNIDTLMKYASFNHHDQDKSWDIYFVIPDYIDYSKYYKDIPNDKIIVSNYGIREDVDLLKEYLKDKNSKKILLYLPEICINSKIKYSKELNIKRINTTTIPIYKIYIEQNL